MCLPKKKSRKRFKPNGRSRHGNAGRRGGKRRPGRRKTAGQRSRRRTSCFTGSTTSAAGRRSGFPGSGSRRPGSWARPAAIRPACGAAASPADGAAGAALSGRCRRNGGFFVLDVPNWQPLDVRRITAAPQTGRMYDGDGQLIMTIKGSQNRVVIPLNDIPQQTRNVFLAAEDLRFYRHHGVDMVRLFGALAANIREGGYSQGASTITMQLIRQSHLSTKKTLSRKAEEIWLAWQLERRMSKDDILAMYLNYIYFGNGAYGIQAAAQTYFGVDARDLTLTQACALAARHQGAQLLRAPCERPAQPFPAELHSQHHAGGRDDRPADPGRSGGGNAGIGGGPPGGGALRLVCRRGAGRSREPAGHDQRGSSFRRSVHRHGAEPHPSGASGQAVHRRCFPLERQRRHASAGRGGLRRHPHRRSAGHRRRPELRRAPGLQPGPPGFAVSPVPP